MEEDHAEVAARLKWRASRNGGRAIATPTATTRALAAARRNASDTGGRQLRTAEIVVNGEIGKDDGQVLSFLMQHVIQHTGLRLIETPGEREQMVGEYLHLASRDPTAQPGRMRVLLSNLDEIRQLRNALHGQHIKVGGDKVGIQVCNDFLDSQATPGNG